MYRLAYEQSDYDALNVVIDFRQAIEDAKLTDKQIESLHYVYIRGLTQEQAANVLGYASHKGIGNIINRAVEKIAVSQGYKEEALREQYKARFTSFIHL